MSGWRNTTIGNEVVLQRGFDITRVNQRAGHVPVVSSSGVTSFHDVPKVKGPGVVLGRKGVVGSVHYIEADFWPHDTTLWVKDFKGNLPHFVYYFFLGLANRLVGLDVGSANPTLNRNHVHPIEVRWPPLLQQRQIANVLGALDATIEHNRRTAQALERLAQAIFQAWFVDFEPVKAKAEGAAEFTSMPKSVFDTLPDRFIESELGPVPAGWPVRALGECVQLTMGQSPSSQYYNDMSEGLPFHQGVTDFGFRFPTHRVYSSSGSRMAEQHDVLLSVRAPVGRINVADRRVVLGRGLAGLRHVSGWQSFLFHHLRHVFAEEDSLGEGTIYKAVTKTFLAQMAVLSPPEDIQAAFEDIAKPLDALVETYEEQCGRLAEMREYLLPLLLSGSVRVEAPA